MIMNSKIIKCHNCNNPKPKKGRALDGRRAYLCIVCGRIWTEGLQGRKPKYSKQRESYQFTDSKGKGHIE